MALATTPGSDCHVPKPTEGILAPVFSWKTRSGVAIFATMLQQPNCVNFPLISQLGLCNTKCRTKSAKRTRLLNIKKKKKNEGKDNELPNTHTQSEEFQPPSAQIESALFQSFLGGWCVHTRHKGYTWISLCVQLYSINVIFNFSFSHLLFFKFNLLIIIFFIIALLSYIF